MCWNIPTNDRGKVVKVSSASCGSTTNNVSKIIALEKWLQIVAKMGLTKLHISKDFQIVVSILQKLINGSPPQKVVMVGGWSSSLRKSSPNYPTFIT